MKKWSFFEALYILYLYVYQRGLGGAGISFVRSAGTLMVATQVLTVIVKMIKTCR